MVKRLNEEKSQTEQVIKNIIGECQKEPEMANEAEQVLRDKIINIVHNKPQTIKIPMIREESNGPVGIQMNPFKDNIYKRDSSLRK